MPAVRFFGATRNFQMRWSIGVGMKIIWIAIVVASACTRRNPNVCCTSAADCQAQQLPSITDCRERAFVRQQSVHATRTDASMDVVQSTDARTCVGAGNFIVCLSTLPTNGVSLAGETIDTDADPNCLSAQPVGWSAAGQPDACFVVGTDVSVSGDTRAQGTRPLVIVATNTLTVVSCDRRVDDERIAWRGVGTSSPATCLSFVQQPSGFGGGAGGTLDDIRRHKAARMVPTSVAFHHRPHAHASRGRLCRLKLVLAARR